jgi:hypothetical protein
LHLVKLKPIVKKSNLLLFFLYFKITILYESLEPLLVIILEQMILFVERLKHIFLQKKILYRMLHNGDFVVWVICWTFTIKNSIGIHLTILQKKYYFLNILL